MLSIVSAGSSSTAQDSTDDVPLVLEYAANTLSGTVDFSEPTPTVTPTETPTQASTNTPTETPTHTPTPTPTETPTQTPTPASTSTATDTPMPTQTATPAGPPELQLLRGVGLAGNATDDGRACLHALLDTHGGDVATVVTDIDLGLVNLTLDDCSINPEIGSGSASDKQISVQDLGSGVFRVTIDGNTNVLPLVEHLFVCVIRIAEGVSPGVLAVTQSVTGTNSGGGPVAIDAPAGEIEVTGCPSDCDASGNVQIFEVVRALNHFGGTPLCIASDPVASCPVADTDNNNSVHISEVVQSLNRFGSGCP